jgi:hypothetical protein
MERFTIIEDEAAVLHAGGVYRQAKLFRRGRELFAAHGSGFIGLRQDGATSVPHVRWLEISVPHKSAGIGRLQLADGSNR